MDEVMEAAIIGVPDTQWGERVVAVIVPKPGTEIDYSMVNTHCRAHLAGFKSPKELQIVDALPRNPSGKVLKRILRDQLVSKNN